MSRKTRHWCPGEKSCWKPETISQSHSSQRQVVKLLHLILISSHLISSSGEELRSSMAFCMWCIMLWYKELRSLHLSTVGFLHDMFVHKSEKVVRLKIFHTRLICFAITNHTEDTDQCSQLIHGQLVTAKADKKVIITFYIKNKRMNLTFIIDGFQTGGWVGEMTTNEKRGKYSEVGPHLSDKSI